MGLALLADRYPNQLSGSEQQRVALARALIKEPEVLLLDEPLSNLDAKLHEQMRFELKELQRRAGIPILYVTHDQTEALAMSDRLAVMNAGRVIQIGTPAEIYGHPTDRFVADFIGLMNFIGCSVVARDGEIAVVKLDNGPEIRIRDPLGRQGRCILAVRPEDVTLDASGPLACRVEIRSYSGNLIDYRVRAGEEILRVQTPNTTTFNEGEQLALTDPSSTALSGLDEQRRTSGFQYFIHLNSGDRTPTAMIHSQTDLRASLFGCGPWVCASSEFHPFQ